MGKGIEAGDIVTVLWSLKEHGGSKVSGLARVIELEENGVVSVLMESGLYSRALVSNIVLSAKGGD